MIFTSYKTLWPYLRQHAWRILGGLAALLWVDFLQLIIPRILKHVVDDLSTLAATPLSLAWSGLIILGMALCIGVFRYFWRLALLGFSRIVERDIRDRLHAKLLLMSPAWYMKRTTGDTMALATNDLEAVRLSAGFGLVALVDAVLLGAASVGFMIAINPLLTLVALIPMPLIPLSTRYLGRLMHSRFRQVQDTFGDLTAQVREYLSGIRVVTAQVRQDMVRQDMDRLGRKYVAQNVRLNMVSGAFFPLMIMFSNLSTAIVIYYGGRMTIFGTITPGDFVAFISYLALLTWPMMALGWMVNLVQRGAASLDRLNAVLNQEPDIKGPASPGKQRIEHGRLKMEGLTFSYPEREEKVLNGLNLTCPAGRITAIVGRTGSGKSTLLNLVPRLFDPPLQTIFLDNMAVEELPLETLRGAVAYVPQDGYIFSGTVAENIAFGRPDASLAEIEAAARAAWLDEDIRLFPGGYQTEVGERGVTLSGGQKQRLALARALLLDTPLLLLDDTLSAVDAEVEEKILASLAELRSGKTTILTAHRVTSLRIADMIHVLENGRITQSGSHEDLIAQDGYYARLYHLQQVGFDLNSEVT